MRKFLAGLLVVVVVVVAAYAFCAMPGERAEAKVEPFTKQPIAHRRYFDNEAGIPENSLPAFQRAIDNGYAIELDVQITADGTPVVFHDQDTERMCGRAGKITSTPTTSSPSCACSAPTSTSPRLPRSSS